MTTSNVPTGPDSAIQTYIAGVVARVSPDATLAEVAEKLSAVEVGALVVSAGTTEVDGIVSERDIVRAIGSGKDPSTTRATEIASTHLVWCSRTDTVAEVAAMMTTQSVRHVLVTEHDRLVGIVSARDILEAYVG